MVTTQAPLALLKRTTCPHCWAVFPPEEVLWISAHAELLGDPRLGAEQPQRFLPTRFDLEGNALDGRGFASTQLACPRCHLHLPRALLEMEPFFVSILGTPACGKSYFLTAMTWELRKLLAQQFAYGFADVDTISNRSLNEYEELLFLNPKCDELVAMADLIRKTELQGELYDAVQYGDQTVNYPRPFLFAMQPKEGHPNYAGADRLARVLCLYDNAGEHFLAGQDSTSTPVTQHLAQSRLLLFLFDPTQDLRFRQLCQKKNLTSPTLAVSRTLRQEAVLHEAANRVRRYAGLAQNAKHNRPLIVVVTKCDAWMELLDDRDMQSPWMQLGRLAGVDVERIEKRSQALRELLRQVCPEIVSAAENFSTNVAYIPVSALGRSPEMDPKTNRVAIRPKNIAPVWATVPLLYGLCRWMPGIIPSLKRRQKGDSNGRR